MYKKSKPLEHPQNSEHGFNYALFLLNLSMQTEAELKSKMARRGYDLGVIDEVLLRLKDLDYINDEKYADSYLSTMKSYKTYGYYSIKQRMLLKKLPTAIIESKLNSDFSEEDEKEVLARYLAKELKLNFTHKTQEALKIFQELPYEDRQRLIRKAAQRGFRMNVLLGN